MNVAGGNPGGKARYFLNNAITIQKLKAGADRVNMKVTDNSQSKSIAFSTGAYTSVVLPLVKMWRELQGHPIDLEDVDGMDISVVQVEIARDLAGIILHYLIELRVQGFKVKVTCYDTTLSMLIQSGKMLEDYCARVLLPYLQAEIVALGRLIVERNAQVRAFGVPRETRQQKKESKKGAAPLEPPSTPRGPRAASLLEPSSSSRTPRVLAYSSPVPKILPLTLLPPAQEEEVEVLYHVRQDGLERRALEWQPLDWQGLEGQPQDRSGGEKQLDEQQPLERQLMERRLQELRLQASQLSGRELSSSSPVCSSRTLPAQLDDILDAELEARHGLFEAIVTSPSQIVPDYSWRMAVNMSIDHDNNSSKMEEKDDDSTNEEKDDDSINEEKDDDSTNEEKDDDSSNDEKKDDSSNEENEDDVSKGEELQDDSSNGTLLRMMNMSKMLPRRRRRNLTKVVRLILNVTTAVLVMTELQNYYSTKKYCTLLLSAPCAEKVSQT